jgi:DNA-binding SARP family transcriptional activator
MMEFLVLGSLEVHQSGESIRVRGMRQQRLLASLLVNANRVVPMDMLVDELWEAPPPSARPQVHNAIRDLRRILSGAGGSTLVTVDAGYRLVVPQDAIDAHCFTSRVVAAKTAEREGRLAESIRLLQSAVDLWRGDAFAGIQCPAVTRAAVRLNEQRLTAIEDLTTLRLQAGESNSLIGELYALLAEHPLRDTLRGNLMIALCRSGRQADALEVYGDGRRYLADELGLELSPRLRSLHAGILADSSRSHGVRTVKAALSVPPPQLPHLPTVSDLRPVPASAAAGPGDRRNYLPHDLTDFTGRSAELDSLLGAAGQGPGSSPLVVSIDGMGGVGKTVLALRVAHGITPSYPDGQYFVALHGSSPTRRPLSPEQALGTLLQAGGIGAEAIPDSLEERSALWRSRLAGRRCLVVLDGAVDSGQVRPLLPGTGGATVLVTSRRKLTALDGAFPVHLDALPRADAVALFTRIVGEQRADREPAQVEKAVELCGHLPLAIRIAATRLRDRAVWRVAELVERLANTSQRTRCLTTAERDVMSMLRASYQDLTPSQREFSQRISLHPCASFDLTQAAAVTGLPIDEVERCFDVLLEHNLIRQDASARFSFHSLVRDCTRELLIEGAEDELSVESALVGQMASFDERR